MAVTLNCKPRCNRKTVNIAEMTEYDLIQYYAKQGLCSCGTTRLRKKNYGPGYTDIPGAECYNCPDSIHRRTLELANADLTKKIAVQAAYLIGNCLFGNLYRTKTRKILLLKDQAAAAAETAQSMVGRERNINNDLIDQGVNYNNVSALSEHIRSPLPQYEEPFRGRPSPQQEPVVLNEAQYQDEKANAYYADDYGSNYVTQRRRQ